MDPRSKDGASRGGYIVGSNAEAGMEQLVQGLRSAYHERISGAADIRTATRQKLAELRTIRKAAAVQEQRQRAVYAEKLSQKVSTLRQATQAFLGQVAAEQEAISAAQRVQLDESAQALKQDVEALRQDVQRFVQELGAAQQVVARNQRQALTAGGPFSPLRWKRCSAKPRPLSSCWTRTPGGGGGPA
jgi:predicted metalloendopeptidase